MAGRHPERDLIPYLRGELVAADRERVERHLAACAECRDTVASDRALLSELAASAPPPPPVHWPRYRAEVRERVEGRVRRSARAWRSWLRPMPAALSVVFVGVLVMLAVHGGSQRTTIKPDTPAFEEIMLGGRLGLLERYEVVERLDLFEDLEVIQHLDGLSATSEG